MHKNIPNVVAPHIKSFDFFLTDWLKIFPKYIRPLTILSSENHYIKITITSLSVGNPSNSDDSSEINIYPNECRQSQTSYSAPLTLKLQIQFNDEPSFTVNIPLGEIPIMIMSKNCNLRNMSPKNLIALQEEEHELGGYFVVKGKERLIRLLMIPRRNIVMCLDRASLAKRDKEFTKYAVIIRCVREDCASSSVYAHMLKSGNVKVGFLIRKREFLLPAVLLLKCLLDTTDKEIFEKILENCSEEDHSVYVDNADFSLRSFSLLKLYSKNDCLVYLGSLFRDLGAFKSFETDEEIGQIILDEHIFIHCYSNEQKFDLMISIIRKLYSMSNKTIKPDNVDTLNFLESMLPGHIFASILQENLHAFLQKACRIIKKRDKLSLEIIKNKKFIKEVFKHNGIIMHRLESFLQTGNIVTITGLDLKQVSGFTISTERINFPRFISHFRSIHRGQNFLRIKTTAIRKLLPECWGFICPVHTPDGELCGLLNHLTSQCSITTQNFSKKSFDKLVDLISTCGLTRLDSLNQRLSKTAAVFLNGMKIGSVPLSTCHSFVLSLREIKLQHKEFSELEIIPVLPHVVKEKFPEILLSIEPGRFVRPVFNRRNKAEELIGAYEQIFLDIVFQGDSDEIKASHCELKSTCTLDSLAACTPFSDFNQSPRNMYQCQMAKQSMGLPFYNMNGRSDEKTYMLKHFQKPIVVNEAYQQCGFSSFPTGLNAIVCVISYTGYDMEDALIINKSAFDRGFFHGSMIKTHTRVLETDDLRHGAKPKMFPANPLKGNTKAKTVSGLDYDGLPYVGQKIEYRNKFMTQIDIDARTIKSISSDSKESFFVRDVRVISGKSSLKISLKEEFLRNPRIGDKFSSRHGQKGTLSQLWPQSNMPFSRNGMVPDILINPHAFPSRMTIGMFVESMAGKVGALEGKMQDGTPFQRFDKNGSTAVEHFGKKLAEQGFDYYGNEEMYSGLTGEKIEVEIFVGAVYYQRLRHMILDKSQVRAIGPVDNLTKQPVKGRKRHGGIRFGEMERDSLLAHGCAFLLQDRILNCSDHYIAIMCKKCKSILSNQSKYLINACKFPKDYFCRICDSNKDCEAVNIPFCLIYLLNELASVNIKLQFDATLL